MRNRSSSFGRQSNAVYHFCCRILAASLAIALLCRPVAARAQDLAPESEPPPPGLVYTVRPGDNLSVIAQRFSTRVEALVAVNGLANPALILAGQRLLVPVLPDMAYGSLGPVASARKGLAMATHYPEDLASLGAAWFYVWGWCHAPGCVPMVHGMELPPACPPVLLVGNEPNAVRPYGTPTSPAEAVARVWAIEQLCPATRLVVGNVSVDDWQPAGGWGSGYDWLAEFLLAYRASAGVNFAHTVGVHCYARYRAGYCLEQLKRLRALYAGPMWLTEFGILSGDARQFELLLDYAEENFERFAAYTNRQPHTGQGWELSVGVELVRPDGTLTPSGQLYADK